MTLRQNWNNMLENLRIGQEPNREASVSTIGYDEPAIDPELTVDAPVVTEQTEPERFVYLQWYEADPARCELEIVAMEERGFASGILGDGRLCFTRRGNEDGECDVAVICDHLYPFKPPAVYIENLPDDLSLPSRPDGAIEVFQGNHRWVTDMAAVTVVDLLEDMISLAGILSEYRDNGQQRNTTSRHTVDPVETRDQKDVESGTQAPFLSTPEG
jgi:hypothetical protein